MSGFSIAARALLAELATRIEGGSIRAGRPETYPRYGEVHDALGLEMHGETVGQSLKYQGLAALAEWTKDQRHPAVTGLIVSNDSNMPGLGYFELFGKTEDDFGWWREQIVRSLAYNWRQFLTTEVPPTQEATDIAEPPPRIPAQVYRILRDTELARRVKGLHEYRCQLCGDTIELPDGSFYAEAHHIHPLGKPHNGPDDLGNILCVCPNHHAMLDYGVILIKATDLRRVDGHVVSTRYVDYHNQQIARVATAGRS